MTGDPAIIFNIVSSVLITNDNYIELIPKQVQKIALNIFWAQDAVFELILNKPLSNKKTPFASLPSQTSAVSAQRLRLMRV